LFILYIYKVIMERIKSVVAKSKDYININKITSLINNPYTIGFIAVVVIIYASFIADNLPEKYAKWFKNPLFKVLFMVIILISHRFSPVLSLILVIAYFVSMLTLSRYTMIYTIKNNMYQTPGPEEIIQMKQEAEYETIQQNEDNKDNEDNMLVNGLHPKNKPTQDTLYSSERIEDPDDPKQQGLQILNDPTINKAIYELNPPFAQKSVVGDVETVNISPLNLPKGGPTRYSAVHGYKLA